MSLVTRVAQCRIGIRRRAMSRALRRLARAKHDAASNPMGFLLENPLKLYRDCMRLADFLAHKQGHSRDALRATVRAPWRMHRDERDPEKVVALRESAVRGLSNYMMYEASQGAMAGTPAFAKEDEDERRRE